MERQYNINLAYIGENLVMYYNFTLRDNLPHSKILSQIMENEIDLQCVDVFVLL